MQMNSLAMSSSSRRAGARPYLSHSVARRISGSLPDRVVSATCSLLIAVQFADHLFSYDAMIFLHTAHPPAHPSQIVPTASNGIDAVNFRQMHESTSLNLERQTPIKAVAGSGIPGSPGLPTDDGLDPPPPPHATDEFSAFSSITLQYDGES